MMRVNWWNSLILGAGLYTALNLLSLVGGNLASGGTGAGVLLIGANMMFYLRLGAGFVIASLIIHVAVFALFYAAGWFWLYPRLKIALILTLWACGLWALWGMMSALALNGGGRSGLNL